MNLLEEAKALLPTLIKHRRFFHSTAEVGFETKKTNQYIKEELLRLKISFREVGGGVLATVKEGEGGVLLRADTDALPIKEESGLPFSAEENAFHGCGHDLHTAMLLGAAELLTKQRDRLSGGVTLMFQPAEEILGGASAMIQDGALACAPRFAYALHVLTAAEVPSGTVLVPPIGASTAASDFFSIRFFGEGAHGATPEKGINPLTAVAQTLLSLEGLLSREVGAERQAVLSLGLMEGGGALNAIADTARLGGSFRTHDEETRAYLLRRIAEIAKSIGEALGVKVVFSHEAHCPALVADAAARAYALNKMEALCANIPKKELPPFAAKPRGGSEDFSFIAERVPSLMLSLAAGERKKGFSYPLHHPRVRFDENALPYGVALLAALAL